MKKLLSFLFIYLYVFAFSQSNVCFNRLHGGFAEIMIPVSQWQGSNVMIRGYSLSGTLVGAPNPFTTSSLPKVTATNGTEYYYIKTNVTNSPESDVVVEASSSSDAAVTHTLAPLPQSEWDNAGSSAACGVAKATICFNRLHGGFAEIMIPVSQWHGSSVAIRGYGLDGTLVAAPNLFATASLPKVTAANGTEYYYIKTSITNVPTSDAIVEASSSSDAAVTHTLAPLPQSEWDNAGSSAACGVAKATICFNRLHGGFAEIMIPVSQWQGSNVMIRGYSLSGTLVGAPNPFTTSSLPKVTATNGTEYYYIKTNVTNSPESDVVVEASSSSDAAVTHTLAPLPQSEWDNAGSSAACGVAKATICFNRLHGGFAEIMIPVSQWHGSSVAIRGYGLDGTLVAAPNLFATASLPKVTAANGTEYYYIKTSITNVPTSDAIVEVSSSSDAAVTHTLAPLPQSEWNNFALQNACINKASGVCVNRNADNYTVYIPKANWNGTQIVIKLYHTNDTLLFNQSYNNPATEVYNGVVCYKLTINYTSYTTESIVAEVSGISNAALHMLLTPTQQVCNGGSCAQIKATTFAQVAPICKGGTFTLPATSIEGYTGSWSPAINNEATTTYTFTADAGQCASGATMTVVINEPVTPVFTPIAPVFAEGVFTLPTTSNNGISGSWSPAINNTTTTTYTFTPNNGQCAVTATLTVTVYPPQTQVIDLSTGKNDDGTIMSDAGIPDTDWSYTNPNGDISTPITRSAFSDWSSASTGGIAGISQWITGNNTITGYHYYIGKQFEIPEGSSDAVLNLRSLSFVRNWTYLVKKNEDGTETETLITQTAYLSDGAKGWLNSRSPEVVNYPLPPGKYFLKVKVYTNSSSQRQATDVNAYVRYLPMPPVLTVDWTKAPNSYIFDIDKAIAENKEGIVIPVVKAYEMWRKNDYFKNSDNTYSPIPAGTQSADVFWEDVPGLIKHVDLVTGAVADSTNLKVFVDRTKGKGNAVISFKVNGNIYWSWHVWVTDKPDNGVTYAQGFETDLNNNPFDPQYMDRNLGATNASFIGNDWNKSGGLQYQWGRKDPIPPLEYKDGSLYEVTGSAGSLRHSGAINTLNSSKIQMITRGIGIGNYTGSNFINDNIKYSVTHPIDYIVHTENTSTWFSNQQYKVPNNDVTLIESWDLWSDNRKGKYNSVNSSNPVISTDSKSYEVKSTFDPCPNGWRIPSNYTSAGVNNNLNPFGRKNSGVNDDNTASSIFYPDSSNTNLDGIKVYPGLGMDFTGSTADRNIGIMPLPGNYEYYQASNQAIYQDQGADGGIMTATYGTTGNGGAAGYRGLLITNDPGQPDTVTGRNTIHINEIIPTYGSGAVRCMKDPNYITANYDFATQYFASSQNIDIETYKTWSKDPNSFIVMTNTPNVSDRIIDINLRKAYAMQRLYLNENNEMPSGSIKTASIQWTSNTNLINHYEIIEGGESGSILRVTLNPNQTGNVVLAFHLGDTGVWGKSNPDKIMWSWHIWSPQTDISETTYTTESDTNGGILSVSNPNFVNPTKSGTPPLTTTFMDRNLGAVTSFPNADGFGGTAIANDPNIRNSGGLHYQWGRKDPIPTFFTPGGVAAAPVFKQIGYANNIITYGAAINDSDYTLNSTAEYNNYSVAGNVQINDPKQERNRKIIKYSVEHPFEFMYHNRSGSELNYLDAGTYQTKSLQIKDWISPTGEVGNAADRWGHDAEKSAYDPCPNGWRIPDVLITSMVNGYDKGTSPWFYNNYKINGSKAEYGFSQAYPFALKASKTNNNSSTEKLYPGNFVKKYTAPAAIVGWEFNFDGSLFNIGNFPNTGIRGRLGGNDWVDRFDTTTPNYKWASGVWTASLGDFYTGYGIAMQMDGYSANGELLTGMGHYPQAGMGVRCAKDVPRYIIDDVLPTQRITVPTKKMTNTVSEILLFPNPTSNEVFVNKKVKSFKLFDMSGKMLQQEERRQSIDMSLLPNGDYIIILNTDEGETISKKIIKK